MKKTISLLLAITTILSLSACGKKDEESTSPTAAPESVATSEPAEESVQAPDSEKETTPAPTPDPRDDEQVIRAEIEKMLNDAEELINEELYDDVRMVLRDIKTRELNEAESKRLNELQTKLVKISD